MLATLTSHVGVRVDVLGYSNTWRLHHRRPYKALITEKLSQTHVKLTGIS